MNPFQLFRKDRPKNESVRGKGHMTWAQTSVGRTVTRTGVFLKKQLWVWPVVAVFVLSILGFTVRSAIESTMKANLESELQTLLSVESAMLTKWLEVQASHAESAANDPEVRGKVAELLQALESSGNGSVAHDELTKLLGPVMNTHDFVGYFVADRQELIVASSHGVLVGQRKVQAYDEFLSATLHGTTTVSAPFPSVVMLQDAAGQVRTGEPTMYACAPIRDEAFQVVAVLALQLRPEDEFTQILQLGQLGESGETYAFDSNGVMVSNSRFDDDLILLGVLPDQPHSRSILNVYVRDPQGDMTAGFRPKQRRSEMPLTRMAAAAISEKPGVDVTGYRDYRGVQVVGAWTWLPKYGIGVATEIDRAEAFHPLTILRRTFWGLYALLVASSIAIFVFTLLVARLQRQARHAAIEAQQLGQYELEKKLGSGGMGVVYKGQHSMMRRPTAIKMLDADSVNDESIERFEREVQITCRLQHPNTIAIYDFGRTPEGVFYYAMEFVDGIDLQKLIETYGPPPIGRSISLLLQVCGSLYEAHTQGLVHRDIKPANVMLCRRGGEPDVIKVLDFGLVRSIDDQDEAKSSGLTGTPLYMSPESIQTPNAVDARSDIYSIGAVGYFLITGKPVFDADSLVDLCQKHVDETPAAPSTRGGVEISAELEYAIMACLEKSRAKRPQTARDLAQLLRKCPEANDWTLDHAEAWWSRHERDEQPGGDSASETTMAGQSGYDQTMAFEP